MRAVNQLAAGGTTSYNIGRFSWLKRLFNVAGTLLAAIYMENII